MRKRGSKCPPQNFSKFELGWFFSPDMFRPFNETFLTEIFVYQLKGIVVLSSSEKKNSIVIISREVSRGFKIANFANLVQLTCNIFRVSGYLCY